MDSSTGDPVWRSDSQASRIAIIAALELEARIPKALCGNRCPTVYVSGPGRDRAYAMAERAVAEGAEALVSWGLAGGLSEQAPTGTVMLPDAVVDDSGRWPTETVWRERLAAVLDRRFSPLQRPLYSAERVLTTRREKSLAANRSGASAVDMESAAIAEIASVNGVAFVAIRVVADGPLDELPDHVEGLVTADGRTRYLGLPGMLTSIRRIRLLLSLAQNSQAARRRMVSIVQELVQSSR
jgi:hypothetical protein